MKKVMNEVTGINELIISAVINSISETTKNTKNEKATPYRLGTATVTYPDESEGIVGALLWEGSLDANPDSFKVGQRIDLRVQLEGEYAGNAVMSLPGMERVDITKFSAFLEDVTIGA